MTTPARLATILAATILLTTTTTAAEKYWPQFRGPDATGLGTGQPPTDWDVKTNRNIRWKVPVPGLGHASPVIWNDRIFLATAVPEDESENQLTTGWMGGSIAPAAETGAWEWQVLCLDRKTGKTLWKKVAHRGKPRRPRHPKASHANCSPATDGRHVVAFFGSEGLYCYTVDGELKWKKDLGIINAAFYRVPDAQWGFGSSPVIHDDLVVIQVDGTQQSYWAAFDIKDGREIQRVERGDLPTWSSPTVYERDGQPTVLCNGYKAMAAYDLKSGEIIWKLSGGGDIPVPTPFVASDHVILTSGHSGMPVYVIKPDARGTLTPSDDGNPAGLAWWHRTHGSYMPTPIALNGILYICNDNGILAVHRIKSGEELYRTRLGSGGSTYTASPVAADGKLFFVNEDGDVHIVQAGPEFELLATRNMGEVCMATPAIVDGELFIRGQQHLFCIAEE